MVKVTQNQMTAMGEILERERIVDLERQLLRRHAAYAGQPHEDIQAATLSAMRQAEEFGFETFQDIRSFVLFYAENSWDLHLPPPDGWIRSALRDIRMQPPAARLAWVRSSLQSRKAIARSNKLARAEFLPAKRGDGQQHGG